MAEAAKGMVVKNTFLELGDDDPRTNGAKTWRRQMSEPILLYVGGDAPGEGGEGGEGGGGAAANGSAASGGSGGSGSADRGITPSTRQDSNESVSEVVSSDDELWGRALPKWYRQGFVPHLDHVSTPPPSHGGAGFGASHGKGHGRSGYGGGHGGGHGGGFGGTSAWGGSKSLPTSPVAAKGWSHHHAAARGSAGAEGGPLVAWRSSKSFFVQERDRRDVLRARSGHISKIKDTSITNKEPPWTEVTTVMMRNLPNKYNQSKLLEELMESGFQLQTHFDFFYLPMDHSSAANLGYCFINFLDTPIANSFAATFQGKRMRRFNSNKTVVVMPASVQGYERNYAYYSSTRVAQADDPLYRPIFVRLPSGAVDDGSAGPQSPASSLPTLPVMGAPGTPTNGGSARTQVGGHVALGHADLPWQTHGCGGLGRTAAAVGPATNLGQAEAWPAWPKPCSPNGGGVACFEQCGWTDWAADGQSCPSSPTSYCAGAFPIEGGDPWQQQGYEYFVPSQVLVQAYPPPR